MASSSVDIHAILAGHRSRQKDAEGVEVRPADHHSSNTPSTAEIPDIFFDHILVDYKLSRIELMVLMYLYRHVWCRANLFRVHGIGPLFSHAEMATKLKLSLDDIYHALRKLEDLEFIKTIRSGQYFVRRYFTEENDAKYGQSYDDFDV